AEGVSPSAGLILSGTCLYGVAGGAGISGAGTVFSMNTDGTGFLPLHSFPAVPRSPGPYTNSEGENPVGLILSGYTIYGTAQFAGAGMFGTIFKVRNDDTGFTVLHGFSSDMPFSTLIDQNGWFLIPTNVDGEFPTTLILSGSTLYGTAGCGGSSDAGTIFSLNTDGTGFTVLHNFTDWSTNLSAVYTNAEGSTPIALVVSGQTLYGVAQSGGSFGNG